MTSPAGRYEEMLRAVQSAGQAQPESGGSKFFGVPDDYVVDAAQAGTGPRAPSLGGYQPSAPRYQRASQDDRRILLGMPPETLADLQDALRQVGLIGKTGYRKGIVDEPTRKGFESLLGFANQTGSHWRQALMQYAAAPAAAEDEVREPFRQPADPGFVNRLTPALTLEAQVQQAAERRLKRRLRGKELQKFISVYQDIETRTNRASYDAQLSAQPVAQEDGSELPGAGATVFEAPSADVAADQYIDNGFAQEAAGQSTYDYFQALQQLIGGR